MQSATFVTACAKGVEGPRQGWLLTEDSDFIIGESGIRYAIEGVWYTVSNPPHSPSKEAMEAMALHL